MKRKVLGMIMVSILATGLLAGGITGKSSETTAAAENVETEAAETEKVETEAGQSVEDTVGGETISLNVAYMPNYGSLWSIENAIAQGYLAEEGIEVNLVEFQDGPIDVGYIGQGAHKLCINGQATIFALSHISNGDAVIGGGNVTSIEELAGKKVAYSSGTSSEDILLNTLAKAGLTMEDIEAVDMDASAIVTAALSGTVDAVATWSPNSLKILAELPGATKLTDNLTFADQTVSLASWIALPDFAQENRDLLVKFTRSLFKAMDYAANDHQKETSELIAAQVAQDVDTVYDQRGDAQWLTGKEVAEGAADGTVEEYYKLQKQNFIATGDVEGNPAVSDYVLLDVMTEAGEY